MELTEEMREDRDMSILVTYSMVSASTIIWL